MLNIDEFEILKALASGEDQSEQGLVLPGKGGYETHLQTLSPDQIDAIYQMTVKKGFARDYRLRKSGRRELESYKVTNAVILAAGGAELSPKLTHLQPRGSFKMNGVPLIERLITQLNDAGIHDIYVVVGYKKEAYLYLEEEFGVTLLINERPREGSIFSLVAALPILDRTYLCNCDNYYPDNPFELYVYDSYYATSDLADSSKDLGVTTNINGRITGLHTGSGPRECLYGHAYFDPIFSQNIRDLLEAHINDFRVNILHWQEFYAEHILDLDFRARKYAANAIMEFDTIQELQAIDDIFIDNISDSLVSIICEQLHCERMDIKNIVISNKGFSNTLFTFSVYDTSYIFRYPGQSSSAINDRHKETLAQHKALEAGIDMTTFYIDDDGCKLAYLVEGLIDLQDVYYHDLDFMEKLAARVKALHECPLSEDDKETLRFDPIAEADKMLSIASTIKGDLFTRFAEHRGAMVRVARFMEADEIEKVLCHNDLNISNVLYTGKRLEIIDWEFAGYNDPAFDFGRLVDAYEPESDETRQIIAAYLGREPSARENAHFAGGVALHSWYYFCWCLYKESLSEDTAFYMVYFFHRLKKWGNAALSWYDSYERQDA